MDTVLQGRSKTVVVGPEQPFCIIGERINPTGRKTFAEQLRAGDLSTVAADANAQIAAGADVLDVNAGIPLVDEAELLASMLKLAQETTDAPICIDSSVIEALEAGLAVYEGKPLVNSVTGEDERLEEILPLVAKHGAAVIGARQRRDRDPRDAAAAAGDRHEDRQGGRRLRDPARGRRDRPAGDDRRRRHRGRHHDARGDPADPRAPRREHVARGLQRVVRAAATGTR